MRITTEEYTALLVKTGKGQGDTTQVVTPKPSKYRNKRCIIDGLEFDSQGEARRFWYNQQRQTRGEISQLRHHFQIPIIVNGVEICYYESDCDYMEGGVWVVEDFKGRKIEPYQLKKKLLEVLYSIRIREIKKSS